MTSTIFQNIAHTELKLNEWTTWIDYQAKLACQFLLQCFPIVKTPTLYQWKQCITVFLIVSSSLTQLWKIGNSPLVRITFILSSSDSSSNTHNKSRMVETEKRPPHTHREGKNSQHCLLTHDPQVGLRNQRGQFLKSSENCVKYLWHTIPR